jgi:hypothetical protein
MLYGSDVINHSIIIIRSQFKSRSIRGHLLIVTFFRAQGLWLGRSATRIPAAETQEAAVAERRRGSDGYARRQRQEAHQASAAPV